jgi:hypothetical protein
VSPYNASHAGKSYIHESRTKDDAPGKQRRPRRRRAFSELKRDINCPYHKCDRVYASKHALNLHIRIKHNGDNSDTVSIASSDSRESDLYSPRSTADMTPASTPQYISDPGTPPLSFSDDELANVRGFEDLLAVADLYGAFGGDHWDASFSYDAPAFDGSLDSLDSLEWHNVPVLPSASRNPC